MNNYFGNKPPKIFFTIKNKRLFLLKFCGKKDLPQKCPIHVFKYKTYTIFVICKYLTLMSILLTIFRLNSHQTCVLGQNNLREIIWKHLKHQLLFWPKNPSITFKHVTNKRYQRFWLNECQKLVYKVKRVGGSASNFKRKTKENVCFSIFMKTTIKGYLTARILFNSTIFIFSSVSALIFWSSKNN